MAGYAPLVEAITAKLLTENRIDVRAGSSVMVTAGANMAFMNTPVTHGSGIMIVTGTGADTAVGRISGMLKSAPTLKTPMTKQLDTLTLRDLVYAK